jgi:hypothetical protein
MNRSVLSANALLSDPAREPPDAPNGTGPAVLLPGLFSRFALQRRAGCVFQGGCRIAIFPVN